MKRNSKKVISLILAAAMTVTSLTFVSFAEDEAAVSADEVVSEEAVEAVSEEAVESAEDIDLADEGEAATEGTSEETPAADTGERAESYVWQLGEGNGAPSFAYEGTKETIFADYGVYGAIIVDATSGKFNNSGRGDAWCQINTGTILYIPALSGTKISIEPYGNEEFTVGTATLSATNGLSYTSNGFDLEEIDGYTYLKVTVTSGGYVSAVSAVNDLSEPVSATSFMMWMDEVNNGGTVAAGEYDYDGSVITLVPGLNGEDYVKQSSQVEGHYSYKASNRPDNAGSLTQPPTSGQSMTFKPAAKGTFTVYGVVPSGKNYMFVDYTISDDGKYTQVSKTTVTGEKETIEVDPGHLYCVYTGGTNGFYFVGFQYIVNEPAQVGVAFTGDDLSIAEVYFDDANTGGRHGIVTKDSTNVVLYKGHTYKLSTNDGAKEATINGSTEYTFTGDEGTLTINIEDLPAVKLSGEITGADASCVESITFTKMVDDVLTDTAYTFTAAEAISGSTYSVEIFPGSYATSVVTNNNYFTNDHVDVVKNTETVNEVYLETIDYDNYTYGVGAERENENSNIKFYNFNFHSYEHGVSGGVGAYLTLPVKAGQKINVTGSYDGEFEVVGNGANSVAVNSGTSLAAAYTAADDDTMITVTATKTGNIVEGSSGCYIKSISVNTAIPYKSEISVPGDYDTLTEAVTAIRSMDRPEGEEGRVTIQLTADLQEQVNVDADYITLEGNGHEVNWYYGIGSQYYSIDGQGYYSESLFRDKYYRGDPASGFWGGTMIVRGNYFKAENATFRNTYNYYVTEKEVEDGVIPTDGKPERTIGTDVRKNAMRERANALAPYGDYGEYKNCTILSSQDTLGVNGTLTNHTYFKDCTIGGLCDYICGAGTMLFDDCTLQWHNEGGTGYLTAPKAPPYIFRNCNIVSENVDGYTTSNGIYGTYGRPWDAASTAYYINCETNGTISSSGWSDMSSNTPENANFYEYNNTSNGEPFLSTRGKELTDEALIATLTSDDVLAAYFNGYEFIYYEYKTTEESTSETTTEESTSETTTEESASEETTEVEVPLGDVSNNDGADNGNISVKLNSNGDGYELRDTSSTDAAELTIPFEAQSSGVVTIDGTFTTYSSNTKYDPIAVKDADGNVVAKIMTNEDKSFVLCVGSDSYDSAGAVPTGVAMEANATYSYSFVINYDTNEISAVLNGTTVSATADEISPVAEIYAKTSGSASRDLDISIPTVTVIAFAPSTTIDESGLRGDVDKSGTITANDAAVLLAYINYSETPNAANWDIRPWITNVSTGNITGDPVTADAALILKKTLNSSTPFVWNEEVSSEEPSSEEPSSEEPSSEQSTEASSEEPSSEQSTEAPSEESSSEQSTEAPSEESSSEQSTEAPEPAGVVFEDTEDFASWLLEYNQSQYLDLNNTDSVAGNTSTKIRTQNKAVFKILDTPISSGKATVSVDIYKDGSDADYPASSAGRSFRIYLENTATENDGTSALSSWTNTSGLGDIFYQITDVGDLAYVVSEDNPSYNASTATPLETMEMGKWYRVVIELDLDNGTSATTLYRHGSDGVYNPEDLQEVASDAAPLVAACAPFSLAQIRLVRTAGSVIYWDNVKVEQN